MWLPVLLPLFLQAFTCRTFLEIKIWSGYVNRQYSKIPCLRTPVKMFTAPIKNNGLAASCQLFYRKNLRIFFTVYIYWQVVASYPLSCIIYKSYVFFLQWTMPMWPYWIIIYRPYQKLQTSTGIMSKVYTDESGIK